MKRLTSLFLILSLTAVLTACTRQQTRTPFRPELTRQLLASNAFSEPLEPLDADIVWMLYGLDQTTLAPEQLTAATAYRSSGATCEEVALLTFADEAAAQIAANALDLYIVGQIQANRDYRPAELPKLEQVFLERRGTTVLLMVANDYETTYDLLTP